MMGIVPPSKRLWHCMYRDTGEGCNLDPQTVREHVRCVCVGFGRRFLHDTHTKAPFHASVPLAQTTALCRLRHALSVKCELQSAKGERCGASHPVLPSVARSERPSSPAVRRMRATRFRVNMSITGGVRARARSAAVANGDETRNDIHCLTTSIKQLGHLQR